MFKVVSLILFQFDRFLFSPHHSEAGSFTKIQFPRVDLFHLFVCFRRNRGVETFKDGERKRRLPNHVLEGNQYTSQITTPQCRQCQGKQNIEMSWGVQKLEARKIMAGK